VGPLSGGPDDAAIGRFLEITALVPSRSRTFTVPLANVPRYFGLSAELVTQMTSLGLPSAVRNGDVYFERSDLVNMSLRLRTGARYRTIRRFWPLALSALEGKRRIGYNLSYVANCPFPEPHTGCRFRILTPRGQSERSVSAGQSGPIFTSDLWLSCEWPELPAIAREVVDIAEHFELTWLPPAIHKDTRFMRKHGLANCLGMSRILAAEGRHRGLQARSVFGFLTSPPYGSVHYWAEVRIEGRWIPIDPLMVSTLTNWNILDSAIWTPYHSLGGILCRLGCIRRPLVMHEGKEVAASFPISHL